MHTLGKWGIATIDCGAADDEIVTVVNGCMVNIAAVFGAGDYSEARPDGKNEPHYEVSSEESKANARLIAAAPDLLEALQAMLCAFQADPESGASINSAAIDRSRAAIKKAVYGE